MTTSLVTGGAGFLGSHLCDELLRRGHRVICVDNLETGTLANIEHIRSESFVHLSVDIIQPYFVDEPVDFVYHLASPASPIDYLRLPLHTLKVGSYGTHHTLGLAKRHRARFLIASTSEVYGKSTELPFREDGDLVLGSTDKGRWSYACSKAIDEFLALAHYRERGLPTIVARLFNTVGPRQTGQYGMVVPTFVRQALAGRPITVFGDGSQRRCFCHVHDVVRALADLMDSDQNYGEVFNIGSSEEVSIEELAERVRDACSSESEIVRIPYEEAYEGGFEDMARRIPDISKIERAVGWRQQRHLDEILTDVIAHQQGRNVADSVT